MEQSLSLLIFLLAQETSDRELQEQIREVLADIETGVSSDQIEHAREVAKTFTLDKAAQEMLAKDRVIAE